MNILLNEESKQLLKKENCFDFIRYFFTITVFIAHFCDLNDIKQFWIISSTTAVQAFFVISGFLIFYSYVIKENLNYYIDKRIRRILPPYVTVIILCFIIGIFITKISYKDYISNPDTYKYLIFNLSFLNFIQPTLPGVFETNPIQAVNGSLWTMKVEVIFYISVPFIFYLLKKYNKLLIFPLLLLSIIYNLYFIKLYEQTNDYIYLLIKKQIGGQLIYFYSGVLIVLYFNYFIKYLKYILPIAIIIYLIKDIYPFFTYLLPLAFAVTIIGIAYSFKYMNFLRKYENISYGMYLYHHPIIQIIVYYKIFQHNIYLSFFLALILTIIISLLSWMFIEKPIIMKRRIFH